jgi:hypothetical protein
MAIRDQSQVALAADQNLGAFSIIARDAGGNPSGPSAPKPTTVSQALTSLVLFRAPGR